jgi:hypothetical protein
MHRPSRIRTYLSDAGVSTHWLLAAAAGWVGWTFFDAWMALAFVCGWGSYVLEEHLTHRFIFHAPAPQSQFWFNALYRLHYGHHDQIHSRSLLFTPLWFSLPLGLLNLLLVSRWVPLPYAVVYVYGGGVCAYLLFEWLHLQSHYKSSDCGRLVLGVKRRHARHHYIDHKNWFTVSFGGALVDRALGKDPAVKAKVENVHTCGLAPNDPRLLAARGVFGSRSALAELSAAARD